MASVIIGLAQLLVEGGEPDRNFERAAALVAEAASKKCDLVLLPETIDFAWTHPSSKTECLPIPGPYSNYFGELAAKHNVYIGVGLTEKRGDKRFNTAILVSPKGEILLKYSKINLLVVEHEYYEIGTTLNVIDTPLGKIGLNICADNYPESLAIAHTLCRMGAQIILPPSSWTVDYCITEAEDPYRDKWIKPLLHIASLYNVVMVSTTMDSLIVSFVS